MAIPPLPDETILLCEVGSTAHGTGIDGGEDHDELGIVIESEREVLGLGEGRRNVMQRTQPEGVRSGPGDTDRTLYPLRKWLKLAAGGNPSIMLALWAPIEHITDQGRYLRDSRHWFVGRHIIAPYRGYMQGQVLRILGLRASGHGRRGGGGREELIAEHGFDTKYAMHAARLGFQCRELLTTGELGLPIQGEPGEWLRAVRYGRVSFDEWWNRVLYLDADLATLLRDPTIQPTPNRAAIEAFSADAHRGHWERARHLSPAR